MNLMNLINFGILKCKNLMKKLNKLKKKLLLDKMKLIKNYY